MSDEVGVRCKTVISFMTDGSTVVTISNCDGISNRMIDRAQKLMLREFNQARGNARFEARAKLRLVTEEKIEDTSQENVEADMELPSPIVEEDRDVDMADFDAFLAGDKEGKGNNAA